MASLELRNVQKSYGNSQIATLKDIALKIDAGEFLILVGPSGCGKSTLMNCIAGLENITGGEILVDGEDISQASPKDRDIAMVFQSYALYPTMSVRDNIAFGLKMRKVPAAKIEEEVARVAKLLQIEPLLERKPSQLSGGQQQRVAMGRALARRPKIYLFDEPLSNLDAKLRVEMRTEIKLMHQRLKTTTVYVTHDQIEAMTLGDKVAVMKDGVIQQFGTPHEIYNNPANLFVASFIGSPPMNFVPLRIRQRDGRWVGVLNSEQGSCELPLPITSDEGLRDRELILGIRPEQIGLSNGSAADLSLLVDIEVVEPTGPDTLVVFALNQVKACCRLAPDQAPRWGDAQPAVRSAQGPAVRRPERRTAGPGAACSHARKQGHAAGFQRSGAGAVRYRPALPAGWG
ncbi:glucose ABC transporter, ATP-binding protein [Stutzerimonas stutzeri]|nr:glucose ABC transporter, ATP-binding protein [Stutzerimonas stutzeri]